VESDFREAPSQMLEEWLWDAPTLEALAKHYQTGESIPTSLLVQMKRASEFGKALATRHQIAIAEAALEYHGHDPANLDSDLVMRKAMERYLPFPFVDGTHYQCSYTHLTSQSALVYKYLWSQVIAKDMFSRFRVQNLSLTKTAKEYCDQVLVPGGSMPAETLVRNFLGRPFDSAAWESWLDDGGSVGKSCQDGRR
jgi:thimet oligopeptidase